MGKVIEKVKITIDPTKSVKVGAVVDRGSTLVVLPQNIVRKLGLKKIRKVKVKYANILRDEGMKEVNDKRKDLRNTTKNEHICNASIFPKWNDIRIADMKELGGMPEPTEEER